MLMAWVGLCLSVIRRRGADSRFPLAPHRRISVAVPAPGHPAFLPRMENTHETGSGSRAHRAPSITWQDSGIDQRSIAMRAEGRSSTSSGDQGPSTPRSKHSATEQQRRTKINDRYLFMLSFWLEMLRELLPHCDQRRGKASFLLEVIEHIRFLQEKVQTYESADPERNHKDSKSMPWAKVSYRSCWRDTQNNSQVQGGDLSASAQDMNKEQCGSECITGAPAALFSIQNVRETSTTAKNITRSNQPPWLSVSTMRQYSGSVKRMLSKHERQTPHDDTHSLSSAYSQGLLNRLTEALKQSGVDTSQANISVEINMDRREREY